jgi:hypothetical protein
MTIVRIACGNASDFTDAQGNTWAADNSFTGGSTFTSGSAIAGTVDDGLYQRERFGNFSYAITVGNGNYKLNLGFAETFWGLVGDRVFDVSAQGVLILDNFDILTEVAFQAALVKTFDIEVTGGSVDLVFTSVVDSAKISNIEILQVHPANAAMLLAC